MSGIEGEGDNKVGPNLGPKIAIGDREAVIGYVQSLATVAAAGSSVDNYGKPITALRLNLNLQALGIKGCRYLVDDKGEGVVSVEENYDGNRSVVRYYKAELESVVIRPSSLPGFRLGAIMDNIAERGAVTGDEIRMIEEILPDYGADEA